MGDLIVKEAKFGKGVFANRNFKKGEQISEFHGKVFSTKEVPTPYNEVEDHYVQVDEDLFMGPSGGLDDFFNHTCNPNAGVKIKMGKMALIAITNIKKGKEITWDYSTTMDDPEGWTMDCACGSKNCRKKIGNFKDLPKKLQQKYIKLGIVPAFILENLKKN